MKKALSALAVVGVLSTQAYAIEAHSSKLPTSNLNLANIHAMLAQANSPHLAKQPMVEMKEIKVAVVVEEVEVGIIEEGKPD
jgi:flagellar basal body rod protein FlgC